MNNYQIAISLIVFIIIMIIVINYLINIRIELKYRNTLLEEQNEILRSKQ
jgi:hypothetical protein